MNRLVLAATVAALLPAAAARADCALERFAELPVTMDGLRATVPAAINGADAVFAIDTGAFYSTLSAASAVQFNLSARVTPGMVATVVGIGGEADVGLARVKQFTLGGAVIPNVEFLVGGTDMGMAGVLGQNIWSIADVEYDFAGGAVRFFTAKGCAGHALAYWNTTHSWSDIDLEPATPQAPFLTGAASVNGAKVRVLFDTGAPVSFLTLRAARRVGLDIKGGALSPAGDMGGIGKGAVHSWTVAVDSFKIGGEEIRNTRLRVADAVVEGSDMLIGADFFLSHRILVANSQHRLFFTYNGGPVFKLDAAPPSGGQVQQVPEGGANTPSTTQAQSEASSAASTVSPAAEAARRGAALVARHEFAQAIVELSQACRLDSRNADCLYERAMAYLGDKQPALALADLESAIKLGPDRARFHLTRAELRLANGDKRGAIEDADAADKLAARTAEARLDIAELYARAGMPEPAIAQYGLWLDSHPEDGGSYRALGGRCWARALANQDLDKALADCTAGLAARPGRAPTLAGRALVRLRTGDLDKAIADDDAALAADPRFAWALYGRGLAETRKGEAARGKADIAAALEIEPDLAGVARAHGLAP